MKNLRSKVIRLAHENPTLRSLLLPLLKKASEPAGVAIGTLSANIDGDMRYGSTLKLYWDDPILTVEISSRGALGGMDGPGGSTNMTPEKTRTVIVSGVKDVPKALKAIRDMISSDSILRDYGRVSKFWWYGDNSKGFNVQKLKAALFEEQTRPE